MRLSFIFLAILIFSCAPKEEAQDYPEKDYHIVGYVAGWKNINPKKNPCR